MRLAIGVHGRFYAFDLAPALLELGVDVTLFTNYPRSVLERFGFPRDRTRSLLAHGAAARASNRLLRGRVPEAVESRLKEFFGRWLSRNVNQGNYDAAFCWSGVAEETFRETAAARLLNRSSFHIAAQRDLLAAEAERVGQPIEIPSAWIVEREQREYALADCVIVPSQAARRSFAQYAPEVPVAVVPLTASPERWRPSEDVIAARLARLRAGHPLRIAFVGIVAYRKGWYDIARVVERLHQRMSFRITGSVQPECQALVRALGDKATFTGHVPEAELRNTYSWADVLLAPSIEDGYAVVLAHAQAAAVPILASENTAARDLLAQGGCGWVVPIRDAAEIIRQLEWCDDNRDALSAMVQQLYDSPPSRSWRDVAAELVAQVPSDQGIR